MSTQSVTLVAIPEGYSRVWDVSSEHIPHLTLLYFGEQDLGFKYPELVSKIELILKENPIPGSFYLNAHKRGTLGDEDADVIFFDESYDFKEIASLRDKFLKDLDILELYKSVDQYPKWTPHLTLGYPGNPADDTSEEDILGTVGFAKLSLWVGDFSGIDFDLGQIYIESNGEKDLEMKHKDESERYFGFEKPNINDLKHYGVKGMKWGVRRMGKNYEARTKREKQGMSKRQARKTTRAQNRIDDFRVTATKGKGGGGNVSVLQRFRSKSVANTHLTTLTRLRHPLSIQKASQLELRKMATLQAKMNNGEAKIRKAILDLQGVRYDDLDFSIDDYYDFMESK